MDPRKFIRHPSGIPIEVGASGQLVYAPRDISDIGIGGLAFRCDCALKRGLVVEIRIPLFRPPFEMNGRVVWCRARGKSFELGVEFLAQDDAFRARMVEQVCYIENYRAEVSRSEGRVLTSEEAAVEWITKFAADFPGAEGKAH
ncbi:MAG: PilZ domain-containing protein [Betaproteobacteria bacterium]|nr:PilZ domain-containing protein [Betaproteobacteria bacterium]